MNGSKFSRLARLTALSRAVLGIIVCHASAWQADDGRRAMPAPRP